LKRLASLDNILMIGGYKSYFQKKSTVTNSGLEVRYGCGMAGDFFTDVVLHSS